MGLYRCTEVEEKEAVWSRVLRGQRDGECTYGREWTSVWRPLDVTNGAPRSNIARKLTARVIKRPSARRSVRALESAWALRGQCTASHVLRMGCRDNSSNY